MAKDYDCKILHHPGKANVVDNAWSRKAGSPTIRDICLKMDSTSPLLDMMKKDRLEGLKKENWKAEWIRGPIPFFLSETVEGC